MPMTQKELVKLLVANGGVEVKGGKGSHVKVRYPGVNRPITVPQKIKKGLEMGILKQAGLR
ncbi:type II toxin-antitoxin system HicA family toxin [Enterococcus sp. BWB1-3]|uniref:type II toxin-antitoxin system HicA family toxin n=1 Tax=unclassified Enterococcus TaxID=2608891 RepID=UPI0019219626|nr:MULTISPECIES: type II toxin-antitoxin system HicA family toxin [unclassified Enterococcus]MBL1230127.1 type II toxin-antitoxin system HicA family toxin [Enterococcus sp. BWB1-3]MCB5955199.1 type II toxin-antitoxin system HicA family toxin [Enterococcus sp. CWB-B31]